MIVATRGMHGAINVCGGPPIDVVIGVPGIFCRRNGGQIVQIDVFHNFLGMCVSTAVDAENDGGHVVPHSSEGTREIHVLLRRRVHFHQSISLPVQPRPYDELAVGALTDHIQIFAVHSEHDTIQCGKLEDV